MAGVFDWNNVWVADTSPLILAPPFTVAAWCLFSGAIGVSSTLPMMGLSSISDDSNYFTVVKGSADKWNINASDTATGADSVATATSVVVDKWYFVVGRFISGSNRRLAVLYPDGSIEHVNSTVSKTPSNIARLGIGALDRQTSTLRYNGLIGEWWWANVDIQSDGGQLDEHLMRYLARNGPFSMPNLAKDVIQYYGMRRSTPVRPQPEDSYLRNIQTKYLIDAGGASFPITLGAHPPVYYNYHHPRRVSKFVPI